MYRTIAKSLSDFLRCGSKEDIDDARVELCSTRCGNDFDAFLVVVGVLVDTFRGQRIIDIRDCDDATGKRNLLFANAKWIILAIPCFVMSLRDFASHSEKVTAPDPLLNLTDALSTYFHMLLHSFAFFSIERPWLSQDRISYRNLADVVEDRTDSN